MAQNKFQVSRYEIGEFKEDKWYCGCGDLPKKLTSKTDLTGGDKFLRCPNTDDCGFFLWEKDEPTARVSNSSPRTPQQNRRRNPGLLTPLSGKNAQGGRQTLNFESSLTSPTPKRHFDQAEVLDEPLLTEILELLASANIEIKASTELQLRHLVNMKVATYETKLRTCETTINDLRSKMVEMES
ncbi:GRF zinc finger domain-containing protein [Penicillium argentinense]|uniref:GRF zinc finger domain-containing protein n=1 Tax=Penicillium argentinense TaxID=1131581 RepID=A0A9W9G0Z4_9EURO|nr:GRF zinc finger domain-containing protein [Penicillium argentinense]KAJ5110119.1 GRF zinc finger domain-containing protein [Penicillium argentinense]